jgi:hypothetical protein
MKEGKQENRDLGFSMTSFSSSFFLPSSFSLSHLPAPLSLFEDFTIMEKGKQENHDMGFLPLWLWVSSCCGFSSNCL